MLKRHRSRVYASASVECLEEVNPQRRKVWLAVWGGGENRRKRKSRKSSTLFGQMEIMYGQIEMVHTHE